MKMFRESEKRGEPVALLDDCPELIPGLLPIYEGFHRLGRPVGMGLGEIPFMEKIAYIDEIGVSGEIDRTFWLRCLERLDSKFLTIQNAKSEKSSKTMKKPTTMGNQRG
jgi:hypothetical protein